MRWYDYHRMMFREIGTNHGWRESERFQNESDALERLEYHTMQERRYKEAGWETIFEWQIWHESICDEPLI